ncbi:Rho termination factor N-terminal domain-containing protein, partial [Tenacibaculum piscium]
MLDISELKTKKLIDLQAIAKTIGLTRVSQLKKLDLVSKILEAQPQVSVNQPEAIAEKPKRKRIEKSSKEKILEQTQQEQEKQQENKNVAVENNLENVQNVENAEKVENIENVQKTVA